MGGLCYISEIIHTEDSVTGVGKGVHQQHRVRIEPVDVRKVKQDVPIASSRLGARYVRRSFFDCLDLAPRLASMDVSGEAVIARRDRQIRICQRRHFDSEQFKNSEE